MAHTINGNNFLSYSAKILERNISNHEVVQVYDWLEGAAEPVYMRNYNRFKDLQLVILISESTDAVAESQLNHLVEQMKICTIKFDDIDKYFNCHFEGKVEQEKLYHGTFKITATLACYKTYLAEVTETISASTSAQIVNAGTMPSELYITITPTADIAELTIMGLSNTPIVIKNLIAATEYIIDGYTFRYLADGANDIGNYDSFEFPVLPTGTTTVLLSSDALALELKYYPKFN